MLKYYIVYNDIKFRKTTGHMVGGNVYKGVYVENNGGKVLLKKKPAEINIAVEVDNYSINT